MNIAIINRKSSRHGFSLIELSVVVLIIGILIYMTLAMGRQQLQIARIKQTQYKEQKIQTALAVYLKTYGRLPCPADGTLPNTSQYFGVQGGQAGYSNPSSANGDATCPSSNLLTDYSIPNLYVGVVPTADLGMSADSMVDGWGNRFTYIVSASCIDPDDWNATYSYRCGYYNTLNSTFNPTQDGARIILKDNNGNQYPSFAAYLVISHGPHGYGAWPNNGGAKITINGGGQASNAEYYNGNLNNTNGTAKVGVNAYYNYYDAPINDGDIASNYFDNITAWATSAQAYYASNH